MYPQQPQGYPQPAAYPQGYPQPAQPYAPPAPQGYNPGGYGGYPAPMPYAPPAPPAVPLPTGTLDSFYSQPSAGGGPSFKFMDANRQPQIGKTYAGIVERPLTNADVRAQEQNGVVRTYKDGRPKFVLVVPMLVQPSQEFPEGRAGWWVKGQARDELARAMAEAGAPEGPPEAGAGITVQLVSVRPVPNMNPAYQYRITYVRPQGAAPVQVAPAAQAVPTPYGPAPVEAVHPEYATAVQAVPQPPQMPVPAYAPGAVAAPLPPQMPVPTQPVAPLNTPVPAAAPANFSPEQAALFAKLTGQNQPA